MPILGCSESHWRTMKQVSAAALNDAEVLIVGPTGVGKELYARQVHEEGKRRSGAFVAVNCGAVPTELFENEMFGHVAGAFTGARPRQPGLVQQAEHGTLFLDEIDSLHMANQVKLLRLIQEREYRPLGDTRTRRVDLRIIAATNADLTEQAFTGQFRQDLFFRLRVIPITVPPLRERAEDIPLLTQHFLERYGDQYGCSPVQLSAEAYARLKNYAWPGNVRELENCARYLLCAYAGKTVGPDELPLLSSHCSPTPQSVSARRQPVPALPPSTGAFNLAKREVVRAFERRFLEESLARHDGNVSAAARAAGKHRRAFFELMRRNGLTDT